MRQIEFRGLRIDGKGWAVGHYVKTVDKDGKFIVFILPIDGLVYRVNGCLFGDVHEVKPETVGQFTGLHDRNGVKIWEGDTVTVNGKEYFIRFNTGVFVAESVIANHLSLLPWQFNGTNVTVTGNIHEPATVRK